MSLKPGISTKKSKLLLAGDWIINPYNSLDNFKVISIDHISYGRLPVIQMKGLYHGSDVVHTRQYDLDDELVVAQFNPMVNFKKNNKTSEEWGAFMKQQASAKTPQSPDLQEWVYHPAKNVVGRINKRLPEDNPNSVFVSYGSIQEIWSLSECRYMKDKAHSLEGMPLQLNFTSLRDCTSTKLNDVLNPATISLVQKNKALAISLGLEIKEAKVSGNALEIQYHDPKCDSSVHFRVSANQEISTYSFRSPFKEITYAFNSREPMIVPGERLKEVMKRFDLTVDENGDLSYNNRNLGYHYDESLTDDDCGSSLGRVSKHIREALKSALGIENLKPDYSSEYGMISFNLNQIFGPDSQKSVIYRSGDTILVNPINWVKKNLIKDEPDFSRKHTKQSYECLSLGDVGADKVNSWIDLNEACSKAIEDKILTIRKEGIKAFTDAEIIQGLHNDNFGLANLFIAKESANQFLKNAAQQGFVKANKKDHSLSM